MDIKNGEIMDEIELENEMRKRNFWAKKLIIGIGLILILLAGFVCFGNAAYQPHDGYEMDTFEMTSYICAVDNWDEKIKFIRIIEENIPDYVAYFVRYGEKVTVDPSLYGGE